MSLLRLALVLCFIDSVHTADKDAWVPISDGLLTQVSAQGLKIGYPGQTAGVTVDPATGAVGVIVCDHGLWRSTDQGATWTRSDHKALGGRCETGFALDADPAGGRLMAFMIYGASGLTLDGDRTWGPSGLSHLDFGAVDWSDPAARTMIAFKHESGEEAVVTRDAAKTWTSLGKGFKAVGIFPKGVLMADRGAGIERSEDGTTWTTVASQRPTGLAMRVLNGIGYWTSDAGVLVSDDTGRTWTILGSPVKAWYGPYFGKNEKHLVVVGREGVHETTDGGATWKIVAPLPPDFKVGFVGPNFAWDVKGDVFYASSMGKPAFIFRR